MSTRSYMCIPSLATLEQKRAIRRRWAEERGASHSPRAQRGHAVPAPGIRTPTSPSLLSRLARGLGFA